MRKFVVSDLHGNGEVYDSIISYLENISLFDPVELYINGDLIDRGLDSLRMLKDVKERSEGKGNIKVHYLGGNHELLMYEAYLNKDPRGLIPDDDLWLINGGDATESRLERESIEEKEELYKYVGTLDLYKKLPETIKGRKLLIVHAKPPKKVLNKCHLKISDATEEVYDAVWSREVEYNPDFNKTGKIYKINDLSKDGYFIIKGHTPLQDDSFKYNEEQNYLNIDGGCSYYAKCIFRIDHVPLVEIENELLTILTFNHNNEIISGHYFDGRIKKMPNSELKRRRAYLEHSLDNCRDKKQKLIKELFK